MEEVKFTRKELFDLVWSTPMSRIAKKYEISDTGLRKLCKRHDIPVPLLGYWQKVAHGKKVTAAKFNERNNNDQEKISLRLRDPSEVKTVAPRATAESYVGIDFNVPKELTEPDDLIILAQKVLRDKIKETQRRNPSYKSHIYCREGVSMEISASVVDRALCFMNALIKILKKRGHKIESKHVIIGAQRIEISLREKTSRITIDEKPSWNTYDYVPNGKLCLKTNIWRHKEWSDKKLSLEEQLPQILQELEEAAEKMRLEQIAYEKRRREEERLTELRRLHEAREDKELKALQGLMSDAMRWQQMTMLRNYISDMESLAKSKGHLDDKMQQWITWAKEKADWFDPSINLHDELLTRVDKHTLKMKRTDAYDFSYFYEQSREKEYNFWQSNWWNRR